MWRLPLMDCTSRSSTCRWGHDTSSCAMTGAVMPVQPAWGLLQLPCAISLMSWDEQGTCVVTFISWDEQGMGWPGMLSPSSTSDSALPVCCIAALRCSSRRVQVCLL